MTCDRWQDQLDAYVDGEDLTDPAGLQAHLQTCSSCAADALSRMQMKRSVQGASARYAPSPEFRLRVQQSLQPRRKPRWAFLWTPAFAGLAIALLLVAVTLSLWTENSARHQAVAELVDMHVATLASANPVDVISTDRHTVKPWFQGKLPFTFNLPELQNSPFTLIGGKVVYFDHRPGAQLLFTLRNHKVSVFVLEDREDQLGPAPLKTVPAETRENAFSVLSWNQGGLRFIAISDAAPSDLRDLSELLKAAGHA